MIKLLRGEFIRLFKSKIFWLGTIFMFCSAAFTIYSRWMTMQKFPDYYSSPDGILLSGSEFIGIVIAVVMGIFIGTDYSHGTIRNKLVVGHSRVKMYFSNLIICIVASLLMYFAWLVAVAGGAVLGFTRNFEMSAGNIAAEILISVFASSAMSAVFLLISMLVTSRSTGVVTVMILSLVMFISALMISARLNESEYFDAYDYVITDSAGNTFEIHEDMQKNPYYLEGTKRKIYEILYDVLPNCQVRQLAIGDGLTDNMKFFPLYSVSIIIVATAAGVLLFRRKDLK
ncbi:MAG: ABC transporter permease subunit [Lachnospiraceae bacterium]|nr:ABC transporter permease subunit [Lachnospiraceae bacterium]